MRIPSLDGLRAVAVLLVVFGHLANDRGLTNSLIIESLGVRIFFVISGFLITGLLLEEFERF